MSNRKWFVRCKAGCLAESMTKEQILTAIAQAVETGEIKDVDTGFVTRLVEQNKGVALYFWVGTQAEYNALTEKADDCYYIITDDTTKADVERALSVLSERIAEIENKQMGAVLFDEAGSQDDNQFTTGGTIEFVASKYEMFAITLHSMLRDCVIFCGKSKDSKNTMHLHGTNIAVVNDSTVYYFRVSIKLDGKHSIVLAQQSTTADFSSATNAEITKIVGIM